MNITVARSASWGKLETVCISLVLLTRFTFAERLTFKS